MPIRLNLLAEAHATEELRRKDPVKRAIWVAGIAVAGMFAWSSYLQLLVTISNSKLSSIQGRISAQSASYKSVLDNQKSAAEMNQKIAALKQLSSARLLYGTFLNSFQKATVDDVQLLHLKVDQLYSFTDAVKPRTNDNNIVIKGKPPTSTENILVTLEGNDSSANPGDQVDKFKEVLSNESYLKQVLSRSNSVSLKNLSAPQVRPDTGKPCVLFALECRFPEKTR